MGVGRELRVCVSVKKRLQIYNYTKGTFELIKVVYGRFRTGLIGVLLALVSWCSGQLH